MAHGPKVGARSRQAVGETHFVLGFGSPGSEGDCEGALCTRMTSELVAGGALSKVCDHADGSNDDQEPGGAQRRDGPCLEAGPPRAITEPLVAGDPRTARGGGPRADRTRGRSAARA